MSIPEKYRTRWDALAQTHPWMRELESELPDVEVYEKRIDKLLHQRDVLQAEAAQLRESWLDAKEERDYWLDVFRTYTGSVCIGSVSQRAAVERLRECRYTYDGDLIRAMLGWGHGPHTGEETRLALIDLLTDAPNGTANGTLNGTCPIDEKEE